VTPDRPRVDRGERLAGVVRTTLSQHGEIQGHLGDDDDHVATGDGLGRGRNVAFRIHAGTGIVDETRRLGRYRAAPDRDSAVQSFDSHVGIGFDRGE